MHRTVGSLVATTLFVSVTAVASAIILASWSAAQKLDETGGNSPDLNSPSMDGCPIQSPDGLSLYFASDRPGGRGGLDIWVSTRTAASAAWVLRSTWASR